MPTYGAADLRGNNTNIAAEKTPDECPICHAHINPKQCCGIYRTATNKAHRVDIIFQCTRQECESAFIGVYQGALNAAYHLVECKPMTPAEPKLPEEVANQFPGFTDIYRQALAAEAFGLTELTGIGLRKALEYLIKEFAIQQHPTKADEIKKVFLGKCIDDYVLDTNLKECAKRAIWLGNDETHYTRKWESHDIRDLKRLLALTINWVDTVMLTQKYIAEMPSPA